MQDGESVPAFRHGAGLDRDLGGERCDGGAVPPRQRAGAEQHQRPLGLLQMLGERRALARPASVSAPAPRKSYG